MFLFGGEKCFESGARRHDRTSDDQQGVHYHVEYVAERLRLEETRHLKVFFVFLTVAALELYSATYPTSIREGQKPFKDNNIWMMS